MKLLPMLFTFAAAVGASAFAAEPATAKPASPYAPLEFLVGGTWVAGVSEPGKPLTRIVLQLEWTENKHAVRFHSEFVRGEKHTPYTNGLYAWNGAKQKLVIFYTDSSGSLTEGDVTVEGATLVNALTVTEASGKTYPIQVRLTKVGPDVFTNEIFLSKNGAWEKFIVVQYERKP